MKNFINKEKHIDLETNEQEIPMSYDEDTGYMSRNNYVNRPNIQMPSRNNNIYQETQNGRASFPNLSNKNLNINQSDLMNLNNQNQNNFQNNETPLYVPPFLMNNVRPSRHHNHNAPQDYLPWSIANIFICVILAMPALFFSVQTRDMKRAGNIKQAKINSKRSLVLNIIGSVLGLFTILLAVILRFALYQLFVHNDVQSQNVPIIAGG